VVKQQKSRRFVARVTAANKLLLRRAAAIQGQSMAKFIITQVGEEVRKGINPSNQIQLDADQSRRFVGVLLAPPRPPPAALKRAIVCYRRRVSGDSRRHFAF
jgi:uncharacterized protein (DUF1778 family)